MQAFILALLPLLEEGLTAAQDIAALRSLFAGAGAAAALRGITLAQWLEIASAFAGQAPQVIKTLSDLHPAFERLITDLRAGETVEESGRSIFEFFTNRPAEIPGYDAAGGVVAIQNPT
jgi:hypothetical protein